MFLYVDIEVLDDIIKRIKKDWVQNLPEIGAKMKNGIKRRSFNSEGNFRINLILFEQYLEL